MFVLHLHNIIWDLIRYSSSTQGTDVHSSKEVELIVILVTLFHFLILGRGQKWDLIQDAKALFLLLLKCHNWINV